MSAATGPLRPSPSEAREIARLHDRITELEDQLAAARQRVEQQQADCHTHRPRHIRTPQRVVRDVPTGGAL